MLELAQQNVLVLGLGDRGRAACELLHNSHAAVVAVDVAQTPELRRETEYLRALGIDVHLGATGLPKGTFDLAVISPAIPPDSSLIAAVNTASIPLISEFELGFQKCSCLPIAVGGTNGKSTTASMIQAALAHTGRKTAIAGDRQRPFCAMVDQTRELDYVVLPVDAFQLQFTRFFRPVVAVLLNLAPHHLVRFPDPEIYAKAYGALFRNQQAFDWAIVQSGALELLRKAGQKIPSKIITFSAADPSADLHLDRGLIISRLGNWAGPLLDIDHCQVRGPHNAENLMAALAVSHVLRVPLETMLEPLKTFNAGPHRFQLVAEHAGVQFINDSKCANVEALQRALLATSAGQGGQPNVWLIAEGKDQGLDYHDLGPILSKKVKRAFLLGQDTERIRSAWSLFTPCTRTNSLLEAVTEAAEKAASGDVVLLSPACSSSDQFRNYEDRGERFCEIVKSICGGVQAANPNISDRN